MVRERGYAATWAVLSVKKYGVPQRRHRLVMVARKEEVPPANFPLAPTHAIRVSAGEALRGYDEGRAITGAMLEKVRMRAVMTSE